VDAVPEDKLDGYRAAVNDLGANILRGGLAAALAALERRSAGLVIEHLAMAGVSGLEDATREDLGARVRGLGLDQYVVASREFLQLAAWLRRAVPPRPEEG
jgi:CRISPR-associated protein Cmr5